MTIGLGLACGVKSVFDMFERKEQIIQNFIKHKSYKLKSIAFIVSLMVTILMMITNYKRFGPDSQVPIFLSNMTLCLLILMATIMMLGLILDCKERFIERSI